MAVDSKAVHDLEVVDVGAASPAAAHDSGVDNIDSWVVLADDDAAAAGLRDVARKNAIGEVGDAWLAVVGGDGHEVACLGDGWGVGAVGYCCWGASEDCDRARGRDLQRLHWGAWGVRRGEKGTGTAWEGRWGRRGPCRAIGAAVEDGEGGRRGCPFLGGRGGLAWARVRSRKEQWGAVAVVEVVLATQRLGEQRMEPYSWYRCLSLSL